MNLTVSVKVNTRNMARAKALVKQEGGRILDVACANITARATLKTVRVDTGAMKSGWRTRVTGPLAREVYNMQEYTIYHELGTVHMIPTPMLMPAVIGEKEALGAAFKELLRGL